MDTVATELVETLGLAPSLRRRHATLDEVEAWLWRPVRDDAAAPTAGKVFAHLMPSNAPAQNAAREPVVAMSWAKFERLYLGTATRMEIETDPRRHSAWYALTTAVVPDSPPLFFWPSRCAWYTSAMGVRGSEWGIPEVAEVRGLAKLPPLWHGSEGAVSRYDGRILAMVEAIPRRGGNCLFPECLRGELHEVRATIARFSLTTPMEPTPGDRAACGFQLGQPGHVLRVYTPAGPHRVTILEAEIYKDAG